MIPLFTSSITQKAKENVAEVLDSTYLSEGKWVDEFETELKRKFRINYLATTNSGTSALFLALKLAGIGKGDKVLVPTQTFIATAFAVLQSGADVEFCDINIRTGNIDVNKLKQIPYPLQYKAIIPVHWGGLPCDLEEINILAQKYNWIVIEDAAQALGATYKNIPIGNYSDITCFSFQSTKQLTTGDGGMVSFRNPIFEHKAKLLRWFGIDRENDIAGPAGERMYNLDTLGYKMHMNNISAAMGLGNLVDFDKKEQRKNVIRKYYNDNIELNSNLGRAPKQDDEEIRIYYPTDRIHGNWLYTILVRDRNDFIKTMKHRGVECSIVHRGIQRNAIFNIDRSDVLFPNQTFWDSYAVNIPFYSDLLDIDVRFIVEQINKGW